MQTSNSTVIAQRKTRFESIFYLAAECSRVPTAQRLSLSNTKR